MQISLKQILDMIPNSRILNTDSPEKIFFNKLKNLSESDSESLSFIASKKYSEDAKVSKAIAFIASEDSVKDITKPIILVEQVEITMGKILDILHPPKKPIGKKGEFVAIHSTASIGENSDIGNFVSIGENSKIGKNSIIEDGVKIGKNVIIGENARIGMNCVFFDDTIIGKNFVVFGNSTFGGDGFKFITVDGVHHKIPQVGKVVIGDDVEIGSNSTVDRGGLEDTVIGNGTKFDNMVHVGHNVVVGKDVIIAGQSGVAGSSSIGDGCLIGGACAVSDHVHLPPKTIMGGGTGLRNTPKQADIYIGWDWAFTFAEFQKVRVNMRHMITFNKFIARIKELEKKAGIGDRG